MAFKQLAPDDQEYIRQCVVYVASHVCEPHDEIRYGFTVEDVRAFAANWPRFDDREEGTLPTSILNNCMNEVLNGWKIAPEDWNRNFTVTPERVELAFDRWRKLKGYRSHREEDIEYVIQSLEFALAADENREAARPPDAASPRIKTREEALFYQALFEVQHCLMHLYRHDAFGMGSERISDRIESLYRLEIAASDVSPANDIPLDYARERLDNAGDEKSRAILTQLVHRIETHNALPPVSRDRGDVRRRILLYEALLTALQLQALPLGDDFDGQFHRL